MTNRLISIQIGKQTIQMLNTYHNLEFTAHDATSVDIAKGGEWLVKSRIDFLYLYLPCVGFKTFVVSEDLAGACSRHGSKEQRVTDTMFLDTGAQSIPVQAVRAFNSPHVMLENTLTYRRALVGLVWTELFSQFAGCIKCSVVDGLKDILV